LKLAWESTPGEWVLLQPDVVKGKASVPPGNYRFYSVGLKARTSSGENLVMSGTKGVPDSAFKAVAGQSTALNCGSPLKLGLTCETSRTVTTSTLGSIVSAILGSSAATQNIQATILGAGGETYSRPYLFSDKGVLRLPDGPTFTVLNADGKQVDSGKMEFG